MKNIFILYLLTFTIVNAATLDSKKTYTGGEVITIKASDLKITPKNWLAIYSEDDDNSWKNVLRWTWTKDKKEGSFDFKGLPSGKYQARVFYNNSYKTEASVNFVVDPRGHLRTTVGTGKKVYKEGERIIAAIHDASGHPKDWIAVYPKGSSNAWENVVKWQYLTGGNIDTLVEFKELRPGSYDVRLFFRNSYNLEAQSSFEVLSNDTSDNIIDQVAAHCIPGHQAMDSIICLFDEKDISYAIDYKEDKFHTKIYDFVRINLKNKTKQVIEANQELNTHYPIQSVSLKEFKFTPVYLYVKTSAGADTNTEWRFQYQGKTILSFFSNDDDRSLYDIHQTNKGKNLVLSYRNKYTEPYGIITDTYDISNPSVAKLIDRQIK